MTLGDPSSCAKGSRAVARSTLSLGANIFERDPISRFALRSDDYLAVGRLLASAGLPTLYVFEGGYAKDYVGLDAIIVVSGHAQAAMNPTFES